MAAASRRATKRGDAAARPEPFGLLTAPRLHVYRWAVGAVYTCFLLSVYRAGSRIIASDGRPIYTDFACGWCFVGSVLRRITRRTEAFAISGSAAMPLP
jgi:hypothetical protein